MSDSQVTPATPRQILAVLTALAPDSQPAVDVKVPADDMLAVPVSYTRMFEQALGRMTFPAKGGWHAIDEHKALPLVKRAQLHEDENLLRFGWLWVHGIAPDRTLVRFPLVTMAVRHGEARSLLSIGRSDVRAVGDPELTDLVADADERRQLEGAVAFGGGALSDVQSSQAPGDLLAKLPELLAWARQAATAAGYPTTAVVTAESNRDGWEAGRYEIVARVYLYVAESTPRQVTIASTLRSWAHTPLDSTAFAAVYGRGEHDNGAGAGAGDTIVRSPIVLSPAQASAVARARTQPVTVISGPPGSGKTQTIAAIALDAVQHGRSVLVGAPSEAAVEALITLMQRVPGPDPVVFGASEQRTDVADRLGQGGGPLTDARTVAAAKESVARATDAADTVRRTVHDLLVAEQLAAGADPMLVVQARRVSPAWFEPGASLAEADRRLRRARNVGGLFRGLRRRLREQSLVEHAGASVHDVDALAEALSTAEAFQHSADLESSGGLDLAGIWPQLIEAEDRRRVAHGQFLNAATHAESRVSASARATMGVVAAALRAGRAARRDKLGEIAGDQLVSALPLWIGTLRDIDDLLPRTPAMFDLVIVDEASQVDQIAAAPALLRGAQAVIVGDPRQLRHVSFVSDAAIAEALAEHRVTEPTDAGLLDVRRLSLFDLAAAAAPTIVLDEHFRSAPHLIGFSTRHFYDGAVSIATTHPRNHSRDCIAVDGTAGERDEQGVNAGEIDRVIDIVRTRLAAARESGMRARVGIVSPFRAQADAIEQRVIDELSLEEIDELALRVGTVHGFQGCERDLVVISLALTADCSPSARGFLADANLFNVMVTRAREEIVVVTCLPPDTAGIVGEYIRYGSTPPSAPPPRVTPPAAVEAVRAELASADVPPYVEYPVGRHTLDLVIGDGDRAAGITFGVHPDGPDAHIERRIALHRAGWEIDEVFDTRWSERRTELAVELVLQARQRMPS